MKVVKLYRPAECPGGCGQRFAVNNDRTIRWHWLQTRRPNGSASFRPCLESRDPRRVIPEPESAMALW